MTLAYHFSVLMFLSGLMLTDTLTSEHWLGYVSSSICGLDSIKPAACDTWMSGRVCP